MRIEVGNPTINWSGMKPAFDEKQIFLVEAGEREYIGMAYEEIVSIDISRQAGLRRSQVIKSNEIGHRQAATEVFRDTFQPHRHIDITDEYRLNVVYQRGNVKGEMKCINGEIKNINQVLSPHIFDAHSIEMVLRMLPLEKGFSVNLPAFHGAKNVGMEVEVEVRGRENYRTSTTDTDAWIVNTAWNDSRQVYWISVDESKILRQSTWVEDEVRLDFVKVL